MSTRTLEIPLRDDAEQTRAIMRAHAQAVNGTRATAPDLTPFLAVQRWLTVAGQRQVLVPFSAVLADLLPADAVRMRRDFRQLFNGDPKPRAAAAVSTRPVADRGDRSDHRRLRGRAAAR
jgi:hypothetical protein